MAETVRDHVYSGVKWNAIGKFGHYGTQFIVSIILARLLLPEEFGLIGMLAIFTAIAQVFIVSGMTAALIQKKDATSVDYSTVFFYNIVVALIFYLLLFFSADYIANFYNQPELSRLTKYISIVFLINSFGSVQATLLSKNLQFKKANIISIIGVVVAGVVAVFMAYSGYGVYSIVAQSIVFALVTNVIYWLTADWKPVFVFSIASFKTLFGFGSRLLASSILDQVYTNLSTLIIGKAFSASTLGYFSRAKATRDIPIESSIGVLNSIILPIFSKSKSEEELIRHHFKFIGLISFLVFPLMMGMAILAKPITVLLFSEKWLPSVPILQLLCIISFSYPISVVLVGAILAKGKSGLFLKLDIYKKFFGLISMFVGLYFGFYAFIIGMIVGTLISVFINIKFVSKEFGFRLSRYFVIMYPSVLLSLIMGVFLFLIQMMLPDENILQVLVLSMTGLVIYFGIASIFKINDFVFLRQMLIEKITK